MGIWRKAREAVENVYDSTSLRDLIDDERAAGERMEPLEYVI
jgi:DNA-binding IscR family transcriptional regulator